MGKTMLILLTNDDGVNAPGLVTLQESLNSLGDVVVCAPNKNCSASSRKLTLDRPLQYREVDDGVFAIDGTPADSVLLAIHHILPKRPALVVSGINTGPNLGQDIFYSGTVGAAMEARTHGVRSVAVSLAAWENSGMPAAGVVARWATELILQDRLPPQVVLNINVPPEIRSDEIRLTRLGRREYVDLITPAHGPHGRMAYWIGGKGPIWEEDPLSDNAAVSQGVVSVTPLGDDLTEYSALETMDFSRVLPAGWDC